MFNGKVIFSLFKLNFSVEIKVYFVFKVLDSFRKSLSE